MQRLIEGVHKFQKDVYPQHRELFEELATRQNPRILFITCADSRIVPDLITQSQPGDLFICRNAGNMVPPYGEVHGGVSATIEYAVLALGIKHIVVCGHTDCGAMKGVLHPEALDNLPTVKTWLNHGELARRIVSEHYKDLPEPEKLAVLTEENVVAQLEHLRTHPSVASRLASAEISLHGWVYDIGHGTVRAWDPTEEQFVPIERYSADAAKPRPRLRKVS
jgi:carbonic anhydrase